MRKHTYIQILGEKNSILIFWQKNQYLNIFREVFCYNAVVLNQE